MRKEEGPLPDWWAAQVLASDPVSYIAQRYAGVEMTPLAPASVKVPVLLVAGSVEDRDRDSLLVAAALENGDALIVEGRGHCQTFLAPEALGAVSDFVTKHLVE